MKKFFTAILAAIMLFITPVAFTGCSEFEAALDMAFENECLREENDELKSQIEDLETEVATLKFEAAFPNRIVGGDSVIELNKTAIYIGDKAGDCITITDAATVTINNGIYDAGQTPFGGVGNTAVWVNSSTAKVIINDGYFTMKGLAVDTEGNKDVGHVDLIYCSAGTIEINGGYFEGADSDVWLVNCKDAAYKDGSASIVVKGGTFVNFDPSNCISEGEGTNFVPEGYMVVSEVFNKDTEDQYILYTVIEAPVENEEVESEEEISPEEF